MAPKAAISAAEVSFTQLCWSVVYSLYQTRGGALHFQL